jgi:hypothetical protein
MPLADRCPGVSYVGNSRASYGFQLKMRRVSPIFASCVFLVAAVAPGAPAADQTRAACFPRDSKTLAQNRVARVYSRPGPGEDDVERTLEACVFSKGAGVELDSPREGMHGHVPPGLVLNGTVVGYAVVDCFEDCSTSVEAVDLLLKPPDENPINWSDASRREEVVKIGSLTVTRSGGLAWIACPRGLDFELTRSWPTCLKPGYKDTVYRDAAGPFAPPERLGIGRDIDPSSLRRKGSKLTWRQGGKLHKSTLE